MFATVYDDTEPAISVVDENSSIFGDTKMSMQTNLYDDYGISLSRRSLIWQAVPHWDPFAAFVSDDNPAWHARGQAPLDLVFDLPGVSLHCVASPPMRRLNLCACPDYQPEQSLRRMYWIFTRGKCKHRILLKSTIMQPPFKLLVEHFVSLFVSPPRRESSAQLFAFK